nr:MAG: hypothetical protein 3 [Leviviridae sp.]
MFPTSDGSIPQFLGGFVGLVFDRKSGVLLDEPDIDAIFAVRQLSLMYSKLLLPTTEARSKKAIDGYIECEQEVRRFDSQRSSSDMEDFRQASTVLWGPVLQAVDEDVYYHRIIPRHGPGSTADQLHGNHKFDQVEWTERLERVFSWSDFIIPNHRYFQEYLPRVNFLEPGQERPVRVVTVPKTLKAPRIIAIEPTCMQYVQQGLMARFVEYIESPWIGYSDNQNPGFGVIGFRSQEPNRLLAREGSLTRELATLDLSEASDRVSNQLVRAMLDNYPNLAEGVDACRSRKADVPGHGVVRLVKFASMGSALTFPMEAMVFSTIIFMAIARAIAEERGELRTRVDWNLIMRYRSKVRVFGDDIVVPVRFVRPVVELLETFGFKVNSNKSFWTGGFRESCGKEFYNGHDVSIVKVRREFPSRLGHGMAKDVDSGSRSDRSRKRRTGRERGPLAYVRPDRRKAVHSVQPKNWRKLQFQGVQAAAVISAVDLRNQCYMQGLWSTARFLDTYLQDVLTYYPTVSATSPALGRISLLGYETERLDPKLHSPLVKGWRVRSKPPKSEVSGVGALLKCLLGKSDGFELFDALEWLNILVTEADHLDRAGRPQSVRIKTGWIRPF